MLERKTLDWKTVTFVGAEGGEGGRWRQKRWKEDGAEPHGLEKPQVARDLIAGE